MIKGEDGGCLLRTSKEEEDPIGMGERGVPSSWGGVLRGASDLELEVKVPFSRKKGGICVKGERRIFFPRGEAGLVHSGARREGGG